MNSIKISIIAIDENVDVEMIKNKEGGHELEYVIDMTPSHIKVVEELFSFFLRDKFPISVNVASSIEILPNDVDEAIQEFLETMNNYHPKSEEVKERILDRMSKEKALMSHDEPIGGVCKTRVC